MKLDKIGQPWQNELLIDNKTWFIDNKNARFACLKRKISNPNPRTREGCPILSNFSLGGAKCRSYQIRLIAHSCNPVTTGFLAFFSVVVQPGLISNSDRF